MSDGALALVVFDVDGTLVDSQGDILAAMEGAFAEQALRMPSREDVLGIVGLSLHEAFAVLAPEQSRTVREQMVEGYKNAYVKLRAEAGVAVSSPLYSGARETLDHLNAIPEVLLGVATGKSRRGLDKLIDGHALQGVFVTEQVADHHPSKPHPSMIHSAIAEAGVDASRVVMVGDTSYDMEMAAAAGVTGIAVDWGYHDQERLSAAQHRISSFDELLPLLSGLWGIR